jgi:hypothetical protein
MKSPKTWSLLAILLLAACWVGCGGPARVPVEGVITLDGKPLAGATISLEQPQAPIKERIYIGETDDAGRYVIQTADRSSSGAPAGTYRVRIASVKVPADANELTPLPKERVPAMYRNGSQSLDVPEGGTTEANFEIKTR